MLLVGINIFGRRDWTMKKVREMPLKVKRRRSAIPQAYELIDSDVNIALFLSVANPRREFIEILIYDLLWPKRRH